MKVSLDYLNADDFRAGSRFYLSYAGSAPTPGNCAALATDISTLWGSHIANNVHSGWSLQEVDVIDIATLTGASGQWTGDIPGDYGDPALPSSIAVNVEFGIARRYRGGKPRMFLPPPGGLALQDPAHWSAAIVSGITGLVGGFFSGIEALSIGAVGTLDHVNLSYYAGFTNITNSSGRTRAVPKYRTAAQVDPVESYAVKAVIGSQRRRRIATTY
jgi:hypothetical protein